MEMRTKMPPPHISKQRMLQPRNRQLQRLLQMCTLRGFTMKKSRILGPDSMHIKGMILRPGLLLLPSHRKVLN